MATISICVLKIWKYLVLKWEVAMAFQDLLIGYKVKWDFKLLLTASVIQYWSKISYLSLTLLQNLFSSFWVKKKNTTLSYVFIPAILWLQMFCSDVCWYDIDFIRCKYVERIVMKNLIHKYWHTVLLRRSVNVHLLKPDNSQIHVSQMTLWETKKRWKLRWNELG